MKFGTSLGIVGVFAAYFTLINVFLLAIYLKWNPIWIAGLSTLTLGAIFPAALAYKSLTEDGQSFDGHLLIFKASENFQTCDVVCGGADKCVFSYGETGVPDTCNYTIMDPIDCDSKDGQGDPVTCGTRGCACLKIPSEDLGEFNMDLDPELNLPRSRRMTLTKKL